jgi:hypothetical protein
MPKTATLPYPILFAKVAADELACVVRRAFTRRLLDEQWRRVIREIEGSFDFYGTKNSG